jgi:DMSO reductase anchor subunit
MHPAGSIILFTTASGFGYGLLFVAGLAVALGRAPTSPIFGAICLGLALGTVTLGLLSSTFHLGHPERAWRALTQWRSSWLSREGVMALATFLPAGYLALGWVFPETGLTGLTGLALAGWLAAIAAGVTVFCTAMIYASLKAVPRWHCRWVPVNYLVLALLCGLIWFDALLRLFGAPETALTVAVIVALAGAFWAKRGYWRHIDGAAPAATAESATGLGKNGSVRLLEPPHTGKNYLLNEMGFRIGRKHAAKLRRLVMLIAFALPAALVVAALMVADGWSTTCMLCAALAVQGGVTVERWLFFAEAEHVVMLYYGDGKLTG